jgi:signal transduction histidine kinase
MFASASHELRTPINVVINCMRCLLANSSKLEPDTLKWVKIAHTSCKFLLSLANDTLDYA